MQGGVHVSEIEVQELCAPKSYRKVHKAFVVVVPYLPEGVDDHRGTLAGGEEQPLWDPPMNGIPGVRKVNPRQAHHVRHDFAAVPPPVAVGTRSVLSKTHGSSAQCQAMPTSSTI